MRIFLSFASEQKNIAEPILLALRNRGHEVFFSHDDLLPGDSFDLRIQKAIAKSELLVFLISPESVAKGRYTLTELGLARDRWRSPRGRVLPVVVAPTPDASMPKYLTAVTLLKPEGNIAAETAAAVDRLIERSRPRSKLVYPLLGIVTGVLSWLAYEYPLEFTRFSFFLPHTPHFGATTILPGMIFGCLIAACIYHHGVREPRSLLLVSFAFTVFAWILAYDSTAWVALELGQYRSSSSDVIPYPGALGGIVGGFVGGFVTVLGVSFVTPRFRRPEPWMTTILIATVLGMLLQYNLFVLFMIWQVAVIAFVDRGMASGGEGPGL